MRVVGDLIGNLLGYSLWAMGNVIFPPVNQSIHTNTSYYFKFPNLHYLSLHSLIIPDSEVNDE